MIFFILKKTKRKRKRKGEGEEKRKGEGEREEKKKERISYNSSHVEYNKKTKLANHVISF